MKKKNCLKGLILQCMKVGLLPVILISLSAGLAYANPAGGQEITDKKLTLSVNQTEIKSVLNQITRKTDVKFVYSAQKIPCRQKVSFSVENEKLGDVLNKLLQPYGIRYEVAGDKIILRKKDDLKNSVVTVENAGTVADQHIAAKPITGKVTDGEGKALSGVSVTVKGTSKGTSTNANGEFNIDGETGDIVEFSIVGYKPVSITVGNNETVAIQMQLDVSGLGEVVVVGYGTQKKVNLSGAVNTVSTKTLTNRPVTSLTNALQGTVPGMAILSRPGDVGADLGSITVRGRGNLGASEPLFVVDGIPVSSGDFARINPNDVGSISVLKDASASAIYGSRAAYGVILVTTKSGKEGKMTVNYNAYYGVQSAVELPDWLGANDYAALRNEADINAGKNPTFSDAVLKKIQDHSDPDFYPDNNWYDLVLKKSAPIWEHAINISGGGKTRYFLSGSIFRQNSLVPGKDLKRYSLRSNTESQVSDKFKIGTNVSYIRDAIDNDGGTFSYTNLSRMTPLVVANQSNGEWGSINAGQVDPVLAKDNPLRTLKEGGRNSSVSNRFLTSVNATLSPIKGLDINGQLSYNYFNSESSAFLNETKAVKDFNTGLPMPSTANTTNSLQEITNTTGRFLAQATASYEKTIGKHFGKLLVGSSFEDSKTKVFNVTRTNFVSNNLNAIGAGSSDPANTKIDQGSIQEFAFQSFFGRFNYAFDNKYLVEASMRTDGSSRFAPGHRWGTYPSFSAAWRLSQENFLQSVSWINELKLRASWGKLGNVNNVGNYDFYDGLLTGTTAILDGSKQDGVYPAKLANPTLSWEKVDMTNIGLDGSLWRNKLNFQVDVFDRMTKGILMTDPSIPQEAGLGSDFAPSVNLAKVQNKGFELSLTHNNHIGDVNFSVGGNFSRIWNKVVELTSGQTDQETGGFYINRVGQPIGSFYIWQAEGLFASDADVAKHAIQSVNTRGGDIKYKDINGDGVINGDDRKTVGSDVPYITYGVNITANYKDFDFALLGQGVADVKVYLSAEASQAFFNGAGVKGYALGRWTTANPNPNAAYPRMLATADNGHNLQTSSFWLFDASYFRIKSISLGYQVPKKILAPLHIQGIRVYASSNNLFTIRGDKRLKDFDPESASVRAAYPQLQSYSFGLNVSF